MVKTFEDIVAEAMKRDLMPKTVVIRYSWNNGRGLGVTEPMPYNYALARIELLRRENPSNTYWLDEPETMEGHA